MGIPLACSTISTTAWKPFWLDTALAIPQQTTRVAFVADNPGRWLLHARAISAQGSAVTWFEVA